MTKTFYDNPDVSKVLSMYEEYRQFVLTSTNQLKELAEQYEAANKKFLDDYQRNMKDYLDRINKDVAA